MNSLYHGCLPGYISPFGLKGHPHLISCIFRHLLQGGCCKKVHLSPPGRFMLPFLSGGVFFWPGPQILGKPLCWEQWGVPSQSLTGRGEIGEGCDSTEWMVLKHQRSNWFSMTMKTGHQSLWEEAGSKETEETKANLRSCSGKPNREFPPSLESNPSCAWWPMRPWVIQTLPASLITFHVFPAPHHSTPSTLIFIGFRPANSCPA